MRRRHRQNQGFTLIEMSIVLVIIGLIVGGVLVGQDLIKAAATRATISQIEKYNTAVTTFYVKYGGIPGDLNAAAAAQFGLVARAGTQGRGDGNGLIEGYDYNDGYAASANQTGETAFFWEDLSSAHLIDGTFNTATDALLNMVVTPTTTPNLSAFVPTARLGGNNYFYVYSINGYNYFTLADLISFGSDGNNHADSGLTVQQAYAIDTKVDDSFPQSGKITAQFDYYGTFIWATGVDDVSGGNPGTAATPSPTTCYDNGGNASNPMTYSMSQNNGAGVNCGLSWRMQGVAR